MDKAIGVLGTNIEQRSLKDNQLLAQFSCSPTRENFEINPKEGVTGDMFYFPRSTRDREMLIQFNPCGNVENYNTLNSPIANPYISGKNIRYMPLK